MLLFDGAMGTQIQARDLSVEDDFWGQENCSEILNLSRPDLIREIHRGYLAAGADAIETNSFGGSPITLGEFDLADQAFEINRVAAVLAREAIEPGRRRPPALRDRRDRPRHPPALASATSPIASLEQAFAVQAAGLIAGGADVILCETCQDPLQLKAAVNGARDRDARRPAASCRSWSRSRSRPPAPCWSAPTSPRPRPSSTRWTCRSSA